MRKNSCGKIAERLEAYLDNELPRRKQKQVAQHLTRCRACSQKLGLYSRLRETLQQAAEAERGALPSLWPVIRTALGEDRKSRDRRAFRLPILVWPRPLWVGLVASLALLIMILRPFRKETLPHNYCRIENISAPDHQLLIYKDDVDDFTIIWVTE